MATCKFATVKGWSMMPLLKEGDIVMYEENQYALGDIILFKYDTFVLTHRLIKKEALLITKGDNTPFIDKAIENKDVIGVATYVIRKNRIIYLNIKKVNDRFIRYSHTELSIIEFLKEKLGIETNKLNGLIKSILLPFYICNYIFLLAHSKKI